jgi:hypothetical protein
VKTRAFPLAMLTLAGLASSLAFVSCSTANQQIGIDAPPFSQTGFQPLGDYLDHRCGSLDCHGQPGRNLRIWGCEGMRLDAGLISNCNRSIPGGGGTTLAEYQATYRSLVGLEPQVMTAVYSGCNSQIGADGGALYPPGPTCHPELLTFVEKARGAEAHKGGQLICLSPPCPPGVPNPNPYDPQDECIVSWLEGATNIVTCGNALAIPTFPSPDASTE